MSEWNRDLETAALHYLTADSIDATGARQIIDGLLAVLRAVLPAHGKRRAGVA
jgi:hypothetical protein